MALAQLDIIELLLGSVKRQLKSEKGRYREE